EWLLVYDENSGRYRASMTPQKTLYGAQLKLILANRRIYELRFLGVTIGRFYGRILRRYPGKYDCEVPPPQGPFGAQRGEYGFCHFKSAAGMPRRGRRHFSPVGVWGHQPPSL